VLPGFAARATRFVVTAKTVPNRPRQRGEPFAIADPVIGFVLTLRTDIAPARERRDVRPSPMPTRRRRRV